MQLKLIPLLERLQRFELADRPDIETKARLLLLDTLACAVAGLAKTEPAALAEQLGLEPGPVLLPGIAQGLTATNAAYVLCLAACWDEACEGLARAHGRPGLHAVATALALGLARNASLGEILDAVVYGYEIGGRAGEALRIRPEMHVDGTWGSLASTAAAARLLKADPIVTQHALAMAACQIPCSLYLPITEGCTARNTYAAHGAAMGIFYAQSAAAGISSPASAFDKTNKLNFRDIDYDAGNPSPFDDIESFYILEAYLKPFAAVRHVHYGAACAQQWRTAHPDTPADAITGIELEIYQEAVTYCGNRRPQTPIQAQFSLSYGLAYALRHNDLDPRAYAAETLQDPLQQRLEEMVKIIADPTLEGRQATLRVSLADRSESYHVDSVIGDLERPMSTAQATAKALRYMAPVIGAERAEKILHTLVNASSESQLIL